MRLLMVVVWWLLAVPCGMAAARCDVQAPVQRVDVGEMSLVYQSVGAPQDPALLLVMGLGGQLIDWPDEVVQALCQEGFRVIRYDNRDAGLTRWRQPPPSASLTLGLLRFKLGLTVSAPYTLTDMADDGLGLMDCLGIERFHVLGVSMGGMIAQHLAAQAPQRVRSLTLVMTSSGAAGLPAPSAALVHLFARPRAVSREDALQQQVELLAALGSPQVRDERSELLRQAATAYDRAYQPDGGRRQIMAILAEPSRVPLLDQLRVPALVVHGTADPLLPVMHGVHLAAHLRGSQLRLIPGLAHRFQAPFKDALLGAILPYLEAQRLETPHLAGL